MPPKPFRTGIAPFERASKGLFNGYRLVQNGLICRHLEGKRFDIADRIGSSLYSGSAESSVLSVGAVVCTDTGQ